MRCVWACCSRWQSSRPVHRVKERTPVLFISDRAHHVAAAATSAAVEDGPCGDLGILLWVLSAGWSLPRCRAAVAPNWL